MGIVGFNVPLKSIHLVHFGDGGVNEAFMGVDHGGGGGTSPPEFGEGDYPPPRFCHAAKF